jgi:hypothetical protein
VHRVLFEALKAAKRRKRVTYNPCEDVDAPRMSSFEIEPPTPEEVRKLLWSRTRCATGPLIHLLVRRHSNLVQKWRESGKYVLLLAR